MIIVPYKTKVKFSNNDDDPISFLRTTGNALLQTDEVKKVRGIINATVSSEIGYGFLVGYAGGYATKKMSQFLAIIVGGALIGMQALSHNGVITVNYHKLKDVATTMLDVNRDGIADGNDLSAAYKRLEAMLGCRLPSGGGLAVGLAMGLCA